MASSSLTDVDAIDRLDLDVVAPLREFPVDRFSHIRRLLREAPFRLSALRSPGATSVTGTRW